MNKSLSLTALLFLAGPTLLTYGAHDPNEQDRRERERERERDHLDVSDLAHSASEVMQATLRAARKRADQRKADGVRHPGKDLGLEIADRCQGFFQSLSRNAPSAVHQDAQYHQAPRDAAPSAPRDAAPSAVYQAAMALEIEKSRRATYIAGREAAHQATDDRMAAEELKVVTDRQEAQDLQYARSLQRDQNLESARHLEKAYQENQDLQYARSLQGNQNLESDRRLEKARQENEDYNLARHIRDDEYDKNRGANS